MSLRRELSNNLLVFELLGFEMPRTSSNPVRLLWQPILEIVKHHNVKHEVHSFDSGAIMIDIWWEEKFYVVQLDDLEMGLSLVTADTGIFDVIPDERFTDVDAFKRRLEEVFK